MTKEYFIPGQKVDTKPTKKTLERRLWLKEQIEKYGRKNLNIRAIAKQWKVNHKTIYKDIKAIIDNIVIDGSEWQFDLNLTYKNAYNLAMQGMNDDELSLSKKIQAAHLGLKVCREVTEFLDAWNLKEISTSREREIIDLINSVISEHNPSLFGIIAQKLKDQSQTST